MLYSEGGEYDIIFGTGEIDLRDAKVTDKKLYSEVNVIFGSGTVRINPEIPTVIKISSVFAESKLPGKTINFMGDYTFKTKSYVEGEPFFRLEIDVIFGSVRIIED